MPRAARYVVPEVTLHVIQRGIDRAPCFRDQSDYVAYLESLESCAPRFGCAIHAYCLMTNHVHLLLTPLATDSCAALMKNLGQCHTQRLNRRLERSGPLWEGRYRSCPVLYEQYVLACYRYIELNPVRAGMAVGPGDYRWSSHVANAQERWSPLLTPHPAYLSMSERTECRLQAYQDLFADDMEPKLIDDIRSAARGGHAIGAPRKRRGRPWPGR